ncbi:MAG: hypothetical protein C4533_02025 [Candidatus Omnitrophota bacterium]|jgi:hypothetical protein|nr:MAG: hypothetical protein C4533_02025 [Candidatus Omnitrophota bacterium]
MFLKSFARKALNLLGYDVSLYSSKAMVLGSELPFLLYFKRVFEYIKDKEGDVVECGVHFGRTLLFLSHLVKDEGTGRKIWGFDSFEGLPALSKEDLGLRPRRKGELSAGNILKVNNFLISGGLGNDFVSSQVTLIKGFFKDSLSKYTGSKIAILHIDADLYDSYLTVLNEFYPKVVSGGVVLFDEYVTTRDMIYWPGAQRAIDDFFGDKKNLIQRDDRTGKYYLIKP